MSTKDYATGAFGDLFTCSLTPQIQLNFCYNISTTLTDKTLVGTGTATSVNGQGKFSSGTTTGSSVSVSSKRIAKYRAGTGLLMRFTAIFPEVTGTAFSSISLGYDVNTIGFARDVDGVFINREQGGVSSPVLFDEWDMSALSDYDPTKMNLYQISFGWLGAGVIRFYIMSPRTGNWVNIYNIEYPNSDIAPSVQVPHFPINLYAQNGDTTDDVVLNCASVGVFTEGIVDHLTGGIYSDFTSAITAGSGTLVHALSVRNRATFNGATNFLSAYIKMLSFACEGTKNVRIVVAKNCTLGGQTWANKDTNNSILESATNGTATGGQVLVVENLSKSDSGSMNFSEYGLYLAPNESFSILYTTTASSDIYIDMVMLEDQ